MQCGHSGGHRQLELARGQTGGMAAMIEKELLGRQTEVELSRHCN